MFERTKGELAGIIARKTGLDAQAVMDLLETPPQSALGDLSFPCFEPAKTLRQKPAQFASELAKSLDLSGSLFERAEVKGPYLNFFLAADRFAKKVLGEIYRQGDRFGASEQGKGKRVLIDYSSPNIAKPFHIGHLRSTIIGASLSRIFRLLGYEVVGVNHLGDWGTQFGMVMAAWAEGSDEASLNKDPVAYLLNLYVDYNRRCESDESSRDRAREWFKRLEDGDKEAFELWTRFRNLSLDGFKKVYDRLGVSFDYYWGESFYNDKMASAVAELKAKGLLEKGEDGAEIVHLGDEVPPALIRKSDGATLYITRDLAAAIYRFEKFKPCRVLYVVGRPQELHFRQLFLLVKRLGYSWRDRLEHVKFGHVQGLSTRRGEVIFLEQVLDEARERAAEKIADNIKTGKLSAEVDRVALAEQIGISAILVNDFKNHRERDMVFDWDQALNFEGETGPYLQYTHARICGILRKGGKEAREKVNFGLLSEPETREVVKKLARFPDVVAESASACEPFAVCSYLFDLTSAFNQFYNKWRVLGSGENEAPRLLLVHAVRQVIAQGLRLLGAEPLERM